MLFSIFPGQSLHLGLGAIALRFLGSEQQSSLQVCKVSIYLFVGNTGIYFQSVFYMKSEPPTHAQDFLNTATKPSLLNISHIGLAFCPYFLLGATLSQSLEIQFLSYSLVLP